MPDETETLYVPSTISRQANLPRFAWPPVQYVTQDQLDDAIHNSQQGVNFRINAANGLQILNTEQNRYAPVTAIGANGSQQVGLQDTVA